MSPQGRTLGQLVNLPGARVAAPEVTPLSPVEEQQFRQWAATNQIADVDSPLSFYDYRGFWKANGAVPIRFGVDHFPDTFKQHGHPTFSVESKYSRGPKDGGMWDGEVYVLPDGRRVDMTDQRQANAYMQEAMAIRTPVASHRQR